MPSCDLHASRVPLQLPDWGWGSHGVQYTHADPNHTWGGDTCKLIPVSCWPDEGTGDDFAGAEQSLSPRVPQLSETGSSQDGDHQLHSSSTTTPKPSPFWNGKPALAEADAEPDMQGLLKEVQTL
jgi:hypothetical protein